MIAIDGGSLTRGHPALLTGLKESLMIGLGFDGLPDPDRPVSPSGGELARQGARGWEPHR